MRVAVWMRRALGRNKKAILANLVICLAVFNVVGMLAWFWGAELQPVSLLRSAQTDHPIAVAERKEGGSPDAEEGSYFRGTDTSDPWAYAVRSNKHSIFMDMQSDASLSRIRTGIEAAVQFLSRSVNRRGSFSYQRHEVDPEHCRGAEKDKDPNGRPGHRCWKNKRKYNIVRHAGAVYALGEACFGSTKPFCSGVAEAMVRAARWLIDYTISPVPGVGLAAVFTQKHIEDPEEPDDEMEQGKETVDVKLGGLGLGMIALVYAGRIQPGSIDPILVKKIGNFTVEHMFRPDGLFYTRYVSTVGADPGHKSLYYPGEAALALAMLADWTGEHFYMDAAVRALVALSKDRESWATKFLPVDHWALIATREVLPHATPSQQETLLQHAARIVAVSHERDMERTPEGLLRPASFATGLEGMFAMFGPLKKAGHNLTKEFCLAANTAGLLAAGQMVYDPIVHGGLPSKFLLENSSRLSGRRFLADGGRLRIDDTQHTISCWLSFLRAREELGPVRCPPLPAHPGLARPLNWTPLAA